MNFKKLIFLYGYAPVIRYSSLQIVPSWVRDLNGCHGNQTTFWTLPYMVATESPTVIAFK